MFRSFLVYYGWWACLVLLDVLVADVLPLFLQGKGRIDTFGQDVGAGVYESTHAFVVGIVDLGDTGIESNAKGKGTREDSGHEDTWAVSVSVLVPSLQ